MTTSSSRLFQRTSRWSVSSSRTQSVARSRRVAAAPWSRHRVRVERRVRQTVRRNDSTRTVGHRELSATDRGYPGVAVRDPHPETVRRHRSGACRIAPRHRPDAAPSLAAANSCPRLFFRWLCGCAHSGGTRCRDRSCLSDASRHLLLAQAVRTRASSLSAMKLTLSWLRRARMSGDRPVICVRLVPCRFGRVPLRGTRASTQRGVRRLSLWPWSPLWLRRAPRHRRPQRPRRRPISRHRRRCEQARATTPCIPDVEATRCRSPRRPLRRSSPPIVPGGRQRRTAAATPPGVPLSPGPSQRTGPPGSPVAETQVHDGRGLTRYATSSGGGLDPQEDPHEGPAPRVAVVEQETETRAPKPLSRRPNPEQQRRTNIEPGRRQRRPSDTQHGLVGSRSGNVVVNDGDGQAGSRVDLIDMTRGSSPGKPNSTG